MKLLRWQDDQRSRLISRPVPTAIGSRQEGSKLSSLIFTGRCPA